MKSTPNSVRGKFSRSLAFLRRPELAPHREVRPSLWGEQLEARALLAGDTSADVQITADMLARCDVDSDGALAPRDALMLVNDLNTYGARALDASPAVALAGDTLTPLGQEGDVDGDQQLSPRDALVVLNALATADPNDKVRVRLAVVDAQGNQLSSVKVGDTFFVRAFVQDLRASASGAFAVYTDITYQSDLAKVNGAIAYSADYASGKSGSTATAGLVDEAGAFAGLTPTGADEKLVFTVPFTANAAGTLNFAPDPADTKPAHDILLYGTNTPVLNDEIEFVGASVTVTAETPPNITIADVTADEGNAAGQMQFTVTLSAANSGTVTLNYATQDGTAVAGQDYTTSSGTLTFAPGETSKVITIPIVGDTQAEPTETFRVLLSNASGGNITDGEAVGTLTNDDGAPPTLSVSSPAAVRETSPGNTTIVFTVTLSHTSTLPVSVAYATPGITATAGQDYNSLNGTLNFQPGQTSRQVAIQILSDDLEEPTETFAFNLSNALNATIAGGEAVGTILDNDQSVRINLQANVSVPEGNAGNSDAVVAVTLSQAAAQDVVIKYHTEDNTAKAGTDYVATTTGTITIAAGKTAGEIRVPVIGNTEAQTNRSFRVILDDGGAAGIDNGTSTVLIQDDDLGISIANAPAIQEGNSGTVDLIYTVTLSKASTEAVTVDFATADGTATAGTDYIAKSGTLTFAAGETSKTFTVVVNGDTVDEPDETVLVNLSNVTGGYGIVDGQGFGTILDDDGPGLPTIAVTNTPTVLEGNSGTASLVFTITLSAAATTAVTVDYASQDGAAGGPDYQPTSGTLTFAPGETSKTVTILVNGDTLDESNETVALNLTNANGATIATPQTLGVILDDDPAVSASIADAQIVEGNSGTKTLEFTVTLSAASGLPITFNYATADQTAVAGTDYTAATGSITFAAGETSKKIAVTINGDTDVEPNETFLVNLSGTTFATIADGQAVGTIVDDDNTPALSIADPTPIAEGNSGTKTLTFTVTLSAAAAGQVTVSYATADGSAIAGSDYVAKSGTLTFAAGETTKTIEITINGDSVVEGNETFLVNLSTPSGATIADGQATGTITNDDAVLPTLSISDPTVAEGNTGTTLLNFVVTLSAAQTTAVTVDFATGNGTAASGSDYVSQTGTLTFAAGETSKTIAVVVNGDTTVEPNETVLVVLSNPTGATIADGQGEGTITNDDTSAQPTLSVNDASVAEGNSGETDMVFTVTLSAAQTTPVTVQYTTAEDTAQVDLDYVGASGTLTFAAGETSKTVTVKVKGDTLAEGNERLFLRLLNPTGATLADAEGVGTIQDDGDTALTLTIDDVSQNEGDNNTPQQFVFTARLNKASDQTVTVNFATADITASSATGSEGDYAAQTGTLTFAPGVTVQQFTVIVRGESRYEANEQFAVNLTNPVGAELGRTKAIGTILNDDAPPTISIGDIVVNEFTGKSSQATFTVTLNRSSGLDTKVNFSTANGAATAGQDFTGNTGTVTIPAGQTSATFNVEILNDTVANEPEETFFVNLSNPVNGTIGDGQAVGTIRDSGADGAKQARYSVRITDINGNPINTLTPNQSFFIEVSVEDLRAMPSGTQSAYADVTYNSNLVSVDGAITYNPAYNLGQAGSTTTAGLIDEAGAVSLTPLGPRQVLVFKVPMKAGSTTGSVIFGINGGDVNEHLTVMSGTNLALLENELDFVGATVQIANVPTISIADQTIVEGNSGTKEMVFTLTLSAAATTAISVTASTAPNTASSGTDFVAKSGETITFNPGETTKTFTVLINGDTLDEGASETFFVNLAAVGNAAISDGQAVGTITDDDNPPTLSVADASVVEGNSGQVNLAFVVSLSAPTSLPVTFTYTTTGNTATAGADFESISTQATIPAGQTSTTVNVRVIGDAIFEPNETLTLTLSNPTNATIADGTAIGTITNDDAEAATPGRVAGTVYLDTNRTGGKESNEKGLGGIAIRLTGTTLTGLAVSQSRTTDANGDFAFENIAPGNYQLIETQPGFYLDGAEKAGSAGGNGIPANDTFNIALTSNMNANNYLFAESGLRPEFVSKRNSIASLTAQDILNSVVATSSGFWYSIDGGVASLKAAASSAKGSVNLELYDSNLNKLASSASGSTADLNYQTSPDQSYLLKVGGNSSSATLRVSADVVQDGDTVTVQGSSGDDVIEFTAGDTLKITVNGQTHEYDRATVNHIVVNGNGGNDQAMLVGSSGNENVNLTRGFATIDGAGYSVAVNNVAQIRVDGGGGIDAVTLHDSAFDDQFSARGNLMTMQRDGDYYVAAWGFEMAKASALSSSADKDTASQDAIDFALAYEGDWS